MSRKSKRSAVKQPQAKQFLPFGSKVVPDHEISRKGQTDTFHRFQDRSLGGFILREVHSPGGNVYMDDVTPEKAALRAKELQHYAKAAKAHGIEVVDHLDFVAKRKAHEPAKLWTVASRVPGGRTIHDLFMEGDPAAFELQKQAMRASLDYCKEASADALRSTLVTDLLKPSQFVVRDDGTLVMVDTNPPLWDKTYAIDNTVSEAFMQAMAMNILTTDYESIDMAVATISELAETGQVERSITVLANTQYSIEHYPPGHPQIELMQKVGLDMLLERPVGV